MNFILISISLETQLVYFEGMYYITKVSHPLYGGLI